MKCKRYEGLGLRQRQIIALLEQEGAPLRVMEIAEALDMPDNLVVAGCALKALERRGIVEKAPGKRGGWSLKQNGRGRPREIEAPTPPRPVPPAARPGLLRRIFGFLNHAA